MRQDRPFVWLCTPLIDALSLRKQKERREEKMKEHEKGKHETAK